MGKQKESNLDDLIDTIEDNIIHKKIVMDTALLMFKHLVKEGKTELATDIIARASVHDNSKFNREELGALIEMTSKNNKKSFIDPGYTLNKDECSLISKHWENNRHHPEFHGNINNMTETDIIEMVCDWYSRSKQFKTNFKSFIVERQHSRFKFNTTVFKRIIYYCNLIERLDWEDKIKDT